MTSRTAELAQLSVLAYRDFSEAEKSKGVDVEGVHYRIHEQVSAPSGYQGTIFQRDDTGELIVAHRGTEFHREPLKDGGIADGSMVLLGINTQQRDAMALTQRAVDLANLENVASCRVPAVTVTGHSLGGTLAQITAHRLGLKAETFNAYGAAGLNADYPKTDPDIVNHVRATDLVSAASPHIGEVRVYALREDIEALSRHGYDNGRHLVDLRNPLAVASGIGVSAHYSENFVDANPRGRSVINDDAAALARDNAEMIGDYRRGVHRLHNVLALPRNALDTVADLGARLAGHPRRDPVPASALDIGRCAVDARDPAHPDHALYAQSRDGVHALDARMGRLPDANSERLAASVYRGVREAGMTRVDQVVLNTATPDMAAGRFAFAVQGVFEDPLRRIARIDVEQALRTPAEDSLRAAQAVPATMAMPALQPVEDLRVPAMAR